VESSLQPIIQLHNVVKHYPGSAIPALDIADLQIHQGEFFSILGPSGSGKTTALRLIAGFEQADRGRISLDQIDVTKVAPYRRNINTVFQSYALFPHMSLADNVAYPLKMAKHDKPEINKRVGEALEMVAMESMAARFPHQVSGGQRQRVALARAFVGRPQVLLLDEPLSALDLNLRQQMQHLLVDLQRQIGITFIYVTHDQGEALSMSSRVAIINEGKIQQLDTPRAIYYQPANRFVAGFIGKSNLIDIQISNAERGAIAHLGDVRFPLPSALKNGLARLMVRFEQLTITQPGTQSDNQPPHQICLSGRISDVLFLGHIMEVKVKCTAGELIAFVPAARDFSLEHGQDVCVSFNLEDCALFDA